MRVVIDLLGVRVRPVRSWVCVNVVCYVAAWLVCDVLCDAVWFVCFRLRVCFCFACYVCGVVCVWCVYVNVCFCLWFTV